MDTQLGLFDGATYSPFDQGEEETPLPGPSRKLDLARYHLIQVNTSGGKDSQTALRVVSEMAEVQGVKDRLVAFHCNLGEVEWPGTIELAERQAIQHGVDFAWARREQHDGESLLGYARRRGKWPSPRFRWCTSDFKRSVGDKFLRARSKQIRKNGVEHVRILNVFGFRAEESSARAKRPVFVENERLSIRARTVEDWLPIHHWTTDDVWRSIRGSGVPYHPAYDPPHNMSRLSCVLCIFAPRGQLISAGRANPELLERYVEVEREIGHDFRQGLPLSEIQAAIRAGERATTDDGLWGM